MSFLHMTLAGLFGRRAHIRVWVYQLSSILILQRRLTELPNRYGRIFRIGPTKVSIGDWKYYRAIYGDPKTATKLPAFYDATTFEGLGNIFRMTNKALHAARRKLSAVPYSAQSTAALEPLIREKASMLVRRLKSESASSPFHTANALELCGLFSFAVVCKVGFAKDFFESVGEDSLAVLKAMDESAMTLIFDSIIPWLRKSGFATRVPGAIGRSYRCRDYWESKTREMVDHFLHNSKETDRYLLTPLRKGIDNFLGRCLSKEELVEEAMGTMFAGSGTTSTTLTYLLYAISKPENRHIQQRLREGASQCPDELFAIKNLPYLNTVIKETFRLYPTIVSTLPRTLNEALTVGSYVLPPETIVGMQNLVHHRDPSIFPQPNCFIPERWLESTEEMEGALTPFSVGRRNCIGQNLATVELWIAIHHIVKRVDLKLGKEMKDGDMDMEDRFNVAPRGKRLMLEVVDIDNPS